MSLIYDIFRCLSKFFKHLWIFCIYLICVFFEIFKKIKFNFVFKIIYLSTHFSYVDQVLD